VSYLGGSGVAGASPVLTKPAGVSVGDLLLVHAQIRGGTGSAATPPAGWNLIDRQDSTTIEGSAFWYRVVDGTEGATFTFSLSNSASSAIIAAYSGIDPVNPIDGFTSISGSVLQVYTMPALTTTKDGTTLVIGGGQKDPTGSFALTPGSWTTRTNTPTSSAYSQLSEAAGPATAGSTGTFTVTGATANTGVFHMLALRPAASGATTLRRAAQGRSGQGRSNFFAGADTTPPGNINVTNVTLTKISRIAGKDATQVTFSGELRHFATQLFNLLVAQIFDLCGWVYPSHCTDLLCSSATNTIDVGQRDNSMLVIWNVNACNTGHSVGLQLTATYAPEAKK